MRIFRFMNKDVIRLYLRKSTSKFKERRATVAQMAEHLTRNEDVGGSIPPGGSRAMTPS
jgi:hypothetical protein